MLELAFMTTEFGGYVEFHHEPAAAGIAMAVEHIYNEIRENVLVAGVVALGPARVIYKSADDYERERMTDTMLFERVAEEKPARKMWTVGLRIMIHHPTCSRDMFKGCSALMRPGGAPEALMIVE